MLLNCENIWLQIYNTIMDDTFILGVIYRHSKGNEKSFISALKLVKLNNMTRKYCIICDFNVNVNSSDISYNCALFFSILSSRPNGVFSLIDKSTRVNSSSSTAFYRPYFKNNISNIIYSCIFLSEISDHFTVKCLVAIINLIQTIIIENLKLQNTCTEKKANLITNNLHLICVFF